MTEQAGRTGNLGPPVRVRDPICGMEIAPSDAAATRILGLDTYSFCSERGAHQFDRQHAASATTGVEDSAAAAAMAASSVTVVTNANRLRGWKPREIGR